VFTQTIQTLFSYEQINEIGLRPLASYSGQNGPSGDVVAAIMSKSATFDLGQLSGELIISENLFVFVSNISLTALPHATGGEWFVILFENRSDVLNFLDVGVQQTVQIIIVAALVLLLTASVQHVLTGRKYGFVKSLRNPFTTIWSRKHTRLGDEAMNTGIELSPVPEKGSAVKIEGVGVSKGTDLATDTKGAAGKAIQK
jgi:hypothetical protein